MVLQELQHLLYSVFDPRLWNVVAWFVSSHKCRILRMLRNRSTALRPKSYHFINDHYWAASLELHTQSCPVHVPKDSMILSIKLVCVRGTDANFFGNDGLPYQFTFIDGMPPSPPSINFFSISCVFFKIVAPAQLPPLMEIPGSAIDLGILLRIFHRYYLLSLFIQHTNNIDKFELVFNFVTNIIYLP